MKQNEKGADWWPPAVMQEVQAIIPPHVVADEFEEEHINASYTDGQQSQDRTK
jgi:hypothetical protein